MDTTTETLTYREIGARLGISPDAARMKAKRMARKGRWRLLPSNHPSDTVRVEVPLGDLVPAEPSPERAAPDAADARDWLLHMVSEAHARVNDLTEQLLAEKDARRRDAAELAAAEARELGTAEELRQARAALAALERQARRPRWRLWRTHDD